MAIRTVMIRPMLVLLVGIGLAACGDDDNEPEHEEHEPSNPSCQAIMEVCHAADTGVGPSRDCHDIAHEDVEDDCAAAQVDCIATCEAELGDAT